MDLSKPTDAEIERSASEKASGEFDGEAAPRFRIERIFVDANDAEDK